MVAVDVTTLTQSAVGLATVLMPLVVAYASRAIVNHLKIFSTAAAAQHVQAGVEALADLAVDAMTSAAAQNKTVEVSDAVAGAMNQVSAQLSKAANVAGTTPENLVARVTSLVLAKLTALGALTTTTTLKTGA